MLGVADRHRDSRCSSPTCSSCCRRRAARSSSACADFVRAGRDGAVRRRAPSRRLRASVAPHGLATAVAAGRSSSKARWSASSISSRSGCSDSITAFARTTPRTAVSLFAMALTPTRRRAPRHATYEHQRRHRDVQPRSAARRVPATISSRQPFEPDDEVDRRRQRIDRRHATRHRATRQRSFTVRLRHLVERAPGKSHAIAAALRGRARATSSPSPTTTSTSTRHWIESIRHVMRDPGVALGRRSGRRRVGKRRRRPGCVEPACTTDYGRLAAPLGLLNYGPRLVSTRPAHGARRQHDRPARRAAVSSAGIAPHLGKLRGTLLSGEDHELCMRVQAAGFRADVLPGAARDALGPGRTDARPLQHVVVLLVGHHSRDARRGASVRSDRSSECRDTSSNGAWHAAAVRSVAAAVHWPLAQLMDNAIDVAFVAGYVARRWGVG